MPDAKLLRALWVTVSSCTWQLQQVSSVAPDVSAPYLLPANAGRTAGSAHILLATISYNRLKDSTSSAADFTAAAIGNLHFRLLNRRLRDHARALSVQSSSEPAVGTHLRRVKLLQEPVELRLSLGMRPVAISIIM